MSKQKYFAFISYSHKDLELAKWLQHEFEYYELPSTLNGRKDLPESFRPIFRDEDELASGELKPQISEALADSEYLIVVCSPNSAQSSYVDSEIREFLAFSHENKRKIFPFIVDGAPHQDEEHKCNECFPKTLLELSKDKTDPMELIAGNIKTTGRDHAFVQILAGTLKEKGIRFTDLWDRYAIEKAEKEQKEREDKEKLQIAQSRFLAEIANDLIDKGDSFLASFLSIKVLPSNIKIPDRPYVLEAEAALRKSLRKDNAFLLGHNHSVTSSIYSKDGNRIYSVSWDKKICVWDAMSCRQITSRMRHMGNINSVSLSNDDSTLVSASDDKMVFIWDSKTLKLKTKPLSHDAPVRHASFSPCGKYLLTALNDGNVCIWDLRGNLIKIFKADDNSVINTVLMDHVNRIITVSHGWDNERTWCNMKIWEWSKDSNVVKCCKLLPTRWPNVQKKKGCISTEWHSDIIGLWFPSLAYCYKRNLLLFASEKHIYIWQLADFRLLRILSFSLVITAFTINEDECIIAVSMSDNKVYLQEIPEDIVSWNKPQFVGKFDYGITALSFCASKKHLLLVSFDIGIIRQVDLGTSPYIKETSILADSICFISKGCFLVASSNDSYPGTIYDMHLMRKENIIQENEFLEDLRDYGISYEDYSQIVFDKKGKRIYCIGDSNAYIYNLTNKKGRIQSINYRSNNRCCFKVISKNGRRALYAFKDGTILLLDVIKGKTIKLLERACNHTLIHSACFSSDSNLIATTSNKGTVRIYNAKDGSFVQKICPIQTFGGNSIEFSQKGDMIICASQDYYVYIWDIDKDKKLIKLKKNLSGHEERVCCASFSSDGKMAVSASPSKIIVWDVESGFPLEIIEMDTTEHNLNFVKFSPDNSRIFVSRGGKLVIIDFPKLQNLIDTTRKRFRYRKLSKQECRTCYLE